MKYILKRIAIFLTFSVIIPLSTFAQVLEVQEYTQKEDQWCWIGSSICVLNYYGDKQITQCQIANWAWNRATWRTCNDNCCSNSSGCCNYPNYNWGRDGSIEDILANCSNKVSTGTQNVGSALSKSQVATAISDGRPIIVRVNSGGHFIAVHGLVNNTLYYMDPWYNEGKEYQTFSTSQINGRSWTHSMICTKKGVNPPPNDDTQAPTAPSNLISSNITSSSVALSWNASNDNVGVDYYTIFSGSNQVATTKNTSYNVTGLTPSTSYSFTVKATDAAKNVSAASNTKTITTLGDTQPTDYCKSSAQLFSEEWISNVKIGTTSYSSENSAYSDFTTKKFDFSQSGSQNIEITPGFSRDAYTEYFSAWIDFNKDGDFEDSGEKVLSKSGNAKVSGTINAPSSLSGETRMRVSMKYGSEAGSCDNLKYGEVEDYTISFSGGNTTEYCASKGQNSSYFWIGYVGLNGMENTSGNDNGYGDYTGKTATIGLGSTQTLNLLSKYSGSTYTVYWAIWIDYNQNGQFEDSERVLDGSTAQTTRVSGNFTVPSTAQIGNTRMRVSMKYESIAGSCENFQYGEVEDYTVNIVSRNTKATIKNNESKAKIGYVKEKNINVLP